MATDSGAKLAASPQHRGLLVPVANPEGVAPLLAVALAAHQPDEPIPRVVAFVRRAPGQSVNLPPLPRALSVASDHASAHNLTIDASAVWSDDPAADIIATAHRERLAWVLLGYHRAKTGSDTMGGVVRDVFAKAEGHPIHVGVFIQGTDRPFERVFAAIDAREDGRASLDLAVRIAKATGSSLRALLVRKRVSPREDDVVAMVRGARATMGGKLHTDVLTKRSLDQLLRQTPGRLLIVGRSLADELGLQLDEVPDGDRCVIVVQGARHRA